MRQRQGTESTAGVPEESAAIGRGALHCSTFGPAPWGVVPVRELGQSMKTNSLVFQSKRQAWARPCLSAYAVRGVALVIAGFSAEGKPIGGDDACAGVGDGLFEPTGKLLGLLAP